MNGIGVFMLSSEEAERSVENALNSGVRLIDTANAYANESATGRGIKKSGVAREEVRAIGLSNFGTDEVKEAIDTMEIKPQMVQVEAHPYYPQGELKKVLAETGMGLMAWYPLGHGDKTLIEEPVFAELASKYNKSNAQIILRWHIQCGNVVIPGSKNPDHIRDNFDIFDFKLTDDEMKKIAALDKNVRYYNATPEQVEAYASIELQPDL